MIALGIAVLIAGCGGGEPQQDESEDDDTAMADTIEITMTDHAYEPSDITVPAGQEVTLQFTNEGSVEHYFVVGDSLTDDGEDVRENLFEGVEITKNKTGGEDEEGEEEDHHENEFELPPGGSGTMTFTLPAEKAGTYTVACFETTDGEMHHEMGMEGTMTVTAEE
ncbi:MAG: cupredoxin domain-containing protein [Salinivenus sp.]